MEGIETTTQNKLIDKSKKSIDDWNWSLFFYIALNTSFLLYGKGTILNYLLIIIASTLLIFAIFKGLFFASYFVILFFEPILEMPFGGSFFRIFEVLFLIAYLVQMMRNWHEIRTTKSFMYGVFFLATALLYSSSIVSILSMLINIVISIHCANEMRRSEKNKNIFLAVLFISATFTGIYSLMNLSGQGYGYAVRYTGVIADSNYSALFYVLGIVAGIGTSLINKKMKICMLVLLSASLLRTVSMSGIFICAIVVLIYCFIKKPKRGFLVIIGAVVTFFIFLNVTINYNSILYGIQYRIRNAITLFSSQSFASVTSGRTKIWGDYLNTFFEQSKIDQLIGGHNTVSGAFRDSMVSRIGAVSHNSIIDMMFMIGIPLTIALCGIFIYSIISGIKKYKKEKNTLVLSISMIKCVIGLFSLTISIFPYRYFYAIFVL